MCGIIAAIERTGEHHAEVRSSVERALTMMRYRGPDASGIWSETGVTLGHRRLSIIDLSEAGNQPLHLADRGLHIVFNGEIYNYRELTVELAKHGFTPRTQSDTELILLGYACHGERFLEHLRGMFAFVLFDEVGKKVIACRDRLGKKPLYYWSDGERIIFASEVKAFHAFPSLSLRVNASSVSSFFALQYIPGPETVYEEVRRVSPGEYVTVDLLTWQVQRTTYWSILQESSVETVDVDIDEIDGLIEEAVRYRLVSDVEVGLLLSGGVDSTLLALYASELTGSKLRAFTVAFDHHSFDESQYAEAIARHTGMEWVVLNGQSVSPETFERIMYHCDEPLGDAACIPTYQIAEVLSKHVKVVLSGEGADELYWGYPHYYMERKALAWQPLFHAMRPLHPLFAGLESSARMPSVVTRMAKAMGRYDRIGSSRWTTVFGDHGLREILDLDHDNGMQFVGRLEDLWQEFAKRSDAGRAGVMADLVTWLPDDLLVKADRMTMAHSVEGRAPFLDHILVEHALRMSPRQKMQGRQGKVILRQLLQRKLPADLYTKVVCRPKHGFFVPVREWLKGPLHDLAEDAFSESSLRQLPFIRVAPARRLWEDCKRADVPSGYLRKVWLLLVYASWYRHHQHGFLRP